MKIRTKIILIVLPLIISSLTLSGISNYLSARAGINDLANTFLRFKAQEFQKYIQTQHELLLEGNYLDNTEFVQTVKNGIVSYAKNLSSQSDTERIFCIEVDGTIDVANKAPELTSGEKEYMLSLYEDGHEGWVEFQADGKEMVGIAFINPDFGWYCIVSEQSAVFYSSSYEIFTRTIFAIGISIFLSFILLIWVTGYLTNPVKRVVLAMEEIISTNEFSARVNVEFPDEIGKLAHTFNIMIEELGKAYQQIKKFAFKSVMAQKNERRVRNIFQKYVPKDVIDSIFENPEDMLVGDDRVLAILFSDIRDFTTISEGMQPTELVASLNKYFSLMVDLILNQHGIVDKYIGDAIMAFFGAPVSRKDDAVRAVSAALDMHDVLKVFNKQQRENGYPDFRIGVGINYGVVTVGNIGSDKKMDYTVIGDMVNLASRLEGLTKEYKQSIIISKSVFLKARTQFPCRLVDKVMAKGKTHGETIYTAKKQISKAEERAWKLHHGGIKFYQEGVFEKAKKQFQNVRRLLPDDYIAAMYIKRCNYYIANPPGPQWNGVTKMTHK